MTANEGALGGWSKYSTDGSLHKKEDSKWDKDNEDKKVFFLLAKSHYERKANEMKFKVNMMKKQGISLNI